MIRLEETEQAAEIEQICFPPNEACSYEHMAARIKKSSVRCSRSVAKPLRNPANFPVLPKNPG